MKIQLFKIRLEDESCRKDQQLVNRSMNRVEVLRVDSHFVSEGNYWSVLVIFEPLPKDENAAVSESDKAFEEPLDEAQQERFDALKIWRYDKAKSLHIPAYFIASNRELARIARAAIESPCDLASVKGFKDKKIELYGEEIVALLNSVAR